MKNFFFSHSRRNFLRQTSLGVAGLTSGIGLTGIPLQSQTHAIQKRNYVTGAEIRMHQGRPTIFINGVMMYPMIYALTDSPGGQWTWEELPRYSMEQFARLGTKLFYVSIWLEDIWKPDKPLNIDLVVRQIRGILDIAPDASVFIRLHVNAPRWWVKANPDEVTLYANGELEEENFYGLYRHLAEDANRSPRASLASEKWRKESTGKVIELLQSLVALPEGDVLVAFQPACGIFHEWHYWGGIENDGDTGIPMTNCFRNWLKAKYGSDRALQKAWKQPGISLETALVPGMKERLYSADGIFRDPVSERQVIDYYQCQHNIVADNIIHFCRIIKENWPRPIITGTFYGYYFSMFGRQVQAGHLETDRVLQSPYVDYISAPMAYGPARDMGECGQSRGLHDSARLNNKLLLDEMDMHPSLRYWLNDGNRPEYERSEDIADSIAVLRRNLTHSYIRGMGLWFYDFGPYRTSGWWNHPALLDEIRRLRELYIEYSGSPYEPASDVLVVFDEKIFYYLCNNRLGTAESEGNVPLIDTVAINYLSLALFKSGAVHDHIYLSDLYKADLNRYKTVLFANSWYMTGEQRKFIHEKVAKNGRHLIWCYAPGYCDGKGLSVDNIQKLTGIRVRKINEEKDHSLQVQHPDLPDTVLKTGKPFTPVFAVADPSAENLGILEGEGVSGFARKESGESTTWFISLPPDNAALLKDIFKLCGCHIYNEAGDVNMCGGNILSIHTLEGGKRSIRLRNGKCIEMEFTPRSTILFDSNTGKQLTF